MRTTSHIRRLASLGMCASVLISIAACGGDDEEADDSGATESEGTPTADQNVRVALHTFPPAGLDPIVVDGSDAENIAANLYNGLVSYDSEAEEFVPELAESWEVSDDSTVWTFTLQSGVQFHGGYGELTADDVVFSYERATGDESIWSSAFENVASFEAADPQTVVITLASPDGNFLFNVMNFHQGQVVSKKAVEELGADFSNNPVGTGPYALATNDPSRSRIVLERFDDHFRGTPTLSEIDFTEIDQESASIALENGELEIILDYHGDPRLQELEDAGFVVHHPPSEATLVTVLNPKANPALAEVKVRQAMLHAVDHVSISETFAPISEKAPVNIVPTFLPEYTEDVPAYEYDPDKARDLLDEAGYPDGFTVRRLVRGVDGIEDRDLLEQEMLAEVGITVEFDPVDPAQFSERRLTGDFEMATRNITESTIDRTLRSILDPGQAPPNGNNGAYYDNPEVTEMMDEGRGLTDEDERQELYQELQEIVMTDLPYLPETILIESWPSSPNLEGMVFDINGKADLFKAQITE